MKNLILVLFLLFPAFANATDACTEQNVGAVQCMAQRMCECKFFRKSEMAGTPDHFGWDCGINRPNCLDYQHIDSSKPYDGPQSVIIDKGGDAASTTSPNLSSH